MSVWRDIFDSLFEALLLVSPKLQLKAVNPAAQTMLGISKPTRKALAALIAHNPWLRLMVETSISGAQTLHDNEARLRLANRLSLDVSVRVSPLMNPHGEVRGALVLLNDRSRQREVERALEGSNANLGLSVVGLAHEIKNPLTGIKGATELLAGMLPAEPRARQYCDVILSGVSRLTALVEQVMGLSGPEPIRPMRVNVHKVLHQALALAGLWPTTPPSVKLEVAFDPSLPPIEADPAALERVFLNLLMNARDAIGEQGTIRLATRMETEFHLTARGRRRRFMRVDVSDSGKGASKEQMAQLFTPFFTTKPGGTGLGLVLSKHIVTLHGGRLWAEAKSPYDELPTNVDGEGYGSRVALSGLTFKVLLPVVEPDAEGLSEPDQSCSVQTMQDEMRLRVASSKVGA
jgi:two-component system nitrogen regulation sensor histidine kinase GlnL